MILTCCACGKEMEVQCSLSDGQHVVCPFCGSKTTYRKPQRIEIPAGGAYREPKPKIGIRRPSALEVTQKVEMEDKLRMAINPDLIPPSMTLPRPPATAPHGVVTAAEERVRMFESMRQKNARTKMLRNLTESAMLLMLLAVLVGLALWWQSHKNKVAAEAARIEAEAEASRLRLAEERDRLTREQREKDRMERERIQREKDNRLRVEREARERAERELRDNKERYQLFKTALMENEFDMFVKAVTNGVEKAGAELCYLIPSSNASAPIYYVACDTNGATRVFRMEEGGRRDEIGYDVFQRMIDNVDYLVAKDAKVYFRSTRKTPATGVLSSAKESDPAADFFGTLSPLLKKLEPTYEELTFDIFFLPKGSERKIFVENLPFGCAWSRQNVLDAIDRAMPETGMQSRKSARIKKFKRTVKTYGGSMIKQGIDGITYVPITPPPERTTYSYGSWRNIIYRRKTVRLDNSRERWSVLYNKALQEDEEEAAYYERQRGQHQTNRAAAQTAADDNRQRNVEDAFRNGTLSYRIRKAKLKE